MSQNIVNLLGAGSGIDTQALVNQLVEVERAAPQQRIDDKREQLETQISDYGLLSSALSTLRDASNALSNPDTYDTPNYTLPDNSNALIVTEVDSGTPTGDYSFTVSQLAQAQGLSTSAVFSTPTESVGTGVLTFNFGSWNVGLTDFTEDTTSTPQTVRIDSSNNSLNGVAEAINDADFGVQASVVNDGSGYRLVLRAESGQNNQLQITASDNDANNTDANGLSRFAFNETVTQMNQTQTGQDANLTINGLAITRESNIVNDIVPGLETILSETTGVGETVNISVIENTQTAQQTVRDFVEAYNLFLEAIEPLVGFNEETDAYGSLANDTLAKNMPSRIRQLLVGDVPGLDNTFTALTNIGIRTELDGSMSISETDFSNAINNNYDQFKSLFTSLTESSSDQITINSFGANTLSGAYDVVVTTTPTQGSLVGTSINTDVATGVIAGLAAPVPTSAVLTGTSNTVALADFVSSSGRFDAASASIPLNLATQGAGATDYDFTISVDGVTSASAISLPIADYASYSDMATALQTAINADANISGVTVSHSSGRFTFTSGTTGIASNVSLTAVGANANQLGISAGTSTQGSGGANDFDFNITVDGTTSGTISLTPGTYTTFDELAAHMQTQINNDSTLSGAGAGVSVSHNGIQFVVTSNSTGTGSTITSATAVGASASTLGITSGSITAGATTGGNTDAYDFVLTLDNVTSGTISLDSGTYASLDDVAAEIQSQINADSTLSAAGATVNVTYDSGINAFTIESQRYGANSSVSIVGTGPNAAQGILDLGFAGQATSGKFVAGAASIPLNLATQGAGANDYDFRISVDGVSSAANISLPVADYASYDAMATALQTAINADANISGVTVSYDDNRFSFYSGTTGSNSSISLSVFNGGSAQLGISEGTTVSGTANGATTGRNVEGTINGVAGFGSGNVLLPALGQAGESLGLIISEGATSATVNFSRGFGGELNRLIDQFLASAGVVNLREESINSDIEDLDEDQSALDRRIEAYQERITAQFIAMEAIVRSLQDSSSFLENTLNNLLNSGNDN